MANTIQGSFGWDNAPFVNAMNEAERVAGRGATNIQNKFLSAFKRSPNMRAERAFSGLFQDLATGDVSSGILSITSRMTGLGLVAGVAIGAGVAAFMKLKERIDETRKASEQLANVMGGSLARTAALSPEEIGSQVVAQRKATEALITKAQESGSGFLSNAATGIKETFLELAGGIAPKKAGGKNAEDTQAQGALEKQRQELSLQTAQSEKLFQIKQEMLFGDQHQAAIQEIMYETERKRALLAKSAKETGLSAEEFRKQDQILRAEGGTALALEDKRNTIKEDSLAIEEKMQKLIKGGLSAEDQKKVRAGLELKELQKQLAGETSPQNRASLSVAIQKKENELRSFGNPNQGNENPFQLGTISAREFERSQASAQFNSQFASFGLTQQQQDMKGAKPESTEVVAAVNEVKQTLIDIFKK